LLSDIFFIIFLLRACSGAFLGLLRGVRITMHAAQLTRCAALLLLLGACLATVPGRPTVMDILAGWSGKPDAAAKAGASVSTASQAGQHDSYGYENNYAGEQKEVCLQEVTRRNCEVDEDDGGHEVWT
jgi:hypothetical protein